MYGIPDRLKAFRRRRNRYFWPVGLQTARVAAGHRCASGRKRLGRRHRAELFIPAGREGWVTCTKEQNHNLYAPTVTRRAYGVYTMRQRLDTVFGGDLAQAVRALVSESGCSQSELEQAIAVLNEKHAEAEEYDLYDPYG